MIDSFQGEYRFLSNFYPIPVVYNGILFSSVENAYQAAKSTDKATQLFFAGLTAGHAKKYGKIIGIRSILN